jgi:DNA-binding NtrC family response regulator
MSTPLSILLVSGNDGILRPLREALERIGFEADVARSSKHARTALERSTPPTVLFVDSDLPDGKCGEVIGLAAHCANPARAIVIIEKVDYDLYLDAMDAGASDFVMPPFSGADIAFLLCSVLDRPRQPHQATALKEARHAVGYNTAA